MWMSLAPHPDGVGEHHVDQPDRRRGVASPRPPSSLRSVGGVGLLEERRDVGGVLGQRPGPGQLVARSGSRWRPRRTSSVAPVCSRTSSSATTSVGSLAASVSRPALLGQDQHPERVARRRAGAAAPRSGAMTTRFRSTTSSRELVGQRLGDLPLGDHAQVRRARGRAGGGTRSRSAGRPGLPSSSASVITAGVDEHVTEPAAVAVALGSTRVGSSSGSRAVMPQGDRLRRPTSSGLLAAASRRPDLARGCGAPPGPRAAGAARSAGSPGWRRRRPRSGADASSRVR